jgi:hypothetical protein
MHVGLDRTADLAIYRPTRKRCTERIPRHYFVTRMKFVFSKIPVATPMYTTWREPCTIRTSNSGTTQLRYFIGPYG